MHRNKLKRLPESLGKLRRLQSLDVSCNNLKELPCAALGSLPRLRTLDATRNPKLTRLGCELARARGMEKLLVDPAKMVTPSKEVCAKGTEDIMRALCKGE